MAVKKILNVSDREHHPHPRSHCPPFSLAGPRPMSPRWTRKHTHIHTHTYTHTLTHTHTQYVHEHNTYTDYNIYRQTSVVGWPVNAASASPPSCAIIVSVLLAVMAAALAEPRAAPIAGVAVDERGVMKGTAQAWPKAPGLAGRRSAVNQHTLRPGVGH